jgi:hypothetical protein
MVQAVSPEMARAQRRDVVANGVPATLTTYFGSNWTLAGPDAPPPPGPEVLYPMAFLVEQSAETTVQTHYHAANQWQVVVGGGGSMGTHAVGPVVVHYTNAFSSYGPLRSGPEGLHYFTLRNGYDPGAQYIPAGRDRLRQVKRRFREAKQVAGAPCTQPGAEVLIPMAEDGMGALRFRLAAGESVTGPDPSTGLGQFWVVTAGSLAAEGAALPRLSLLFVRPEESAFTATAGAEGLEVLALQYPRDPAHI